MISRILFLVATLLANAACASEPVSELIEEQARNHYGAAVPLEAEITVMTTSGTLSKAVGISAFWIDRKSGKFLANAVSSDGNEHRIAGYAVVTKRWQFLRERSSRAQS